MVSIEVLTRRSDDGVAIVPWRSCNAARARKGPYI
jgi:hypothetical protein